MFRSEYQGGAAVDVLAAQGSHPLAACRLANAPHIKKVFDKLVKGYIFAIDGPPSTKLHLPKDDKRGLGLCQPYLALQILVPLGQSFSVELLVADNTRSRRRLVFSTSFTSTTCTPLHVQIPLTIVKRGEWLTLVFDLANFVATNWKGSSYRALEGIVLSASCKLRRIFTLKACPHDTTDDYDLLGIDPPEGALYDSIPRTYEFAPGVSALCQVFGMYKIAAAGSGEPGPRPVSSTSSSSLPNSGRPSRRTSVQTDASRRASVQTDASRRTSVQGDDTLASIDNSAADPVGASAKLDPVRVRRGPLPESPHKADRLPPLGDGNNHQHSAAGDGPDDRVRVSYSAKFVRGRSASSRYDPGNSDDDADDIDDDSGLLPRRAVASPDIPERSESVPLGRSSPTLVEIDTSMQRQRLLERFDDSDDPDADDSADFPVYDSKMYQDSVPLSAPMPINNPGSSSNAGSMSAASSLVSSHNHYQHHGSPSRLFPVSPSLHSLASASPNSPSLAGRSQLDVEDGDAVVTETIDLHSPSPLVSIESKALRMHRAFTPPVIPPSDRQLGTSPLRPGAGAGGGGGINSSAGGGARRPPIAQQSHASVSSSRPTTAGGEIDLVYDPVLKCYYDPKTQQYYELDT